MKKRMAKPIINLGSKLFAKKQVVLAKLIWGIPGVIKHAAPVNIKKYLKLQSNRDFKKFVKSRYFWILQNDDLRAWVYVESIRRELLDIKSSIDNAQTMSPSAVFLKIEHLFKAKDYIELDAIFLSNNSQFLIDNLNCATSGQRVLAGLLFDEEVFLDGIKVDKTTEGFFRQGLNYLKNQGRSISNDMLNWIETFNLPENKKLFYTVCLYRQKFESFEFAIAQWKAYLQAFPEDQKARKNLLLLLCRAGDANLIHELEILIKTSDLDDKLITTIYKAANRINSIEILEKLSHLKKKNQYADRVILDVYRRNDQMEKLNTYEQSYESEYGQDNWYLAFQAKKKIDHGLYSEAVKDFKKVKGQKLYLAISRLKNREINESRKIFRSIKDNEHGYAVARRYLGDIAFYEHQNWSMAVKYYSQALSLKFDYQVKVRFLKSAISAGLKLTSKDFNGLTRDDIFYLKYTKALKDASQQGAVKILSQVFNDYSMQALRLSNNTCFFDSITAKSKRKVNGPVVSVIMTAYKAAGTIDRAIESILNQSYKNIELIIVEDNSPDNTFEYISGKYSNKATILRTEHNSGTYVAKNIGIMASKGDYVTFMDSDDWSHPDRIAMQVKALAENYQVQACQTGHIRMSNDGDLLFRKRGINLDAPISLMVRRNVINTIGYFDSVRASGDSEYINRIRVVFGKEALLHIQAPAILARQASDSLTTSGPTALTWAGMPKVRIDYRRSFRNWHRSNKPKYVEIKKGGDFTIPEFIDSRAS